MKSNTPSFTDVVEGAVTGITDKNVTRAQKTKPKKVGRPRKAERVSQEEKAASEAFIDSYESKVDYRPEPIRLIRALSLTEDKIQQAIEDALTPRQLAFCKEYIIDHVAKAAAIRAGYSPHTAGPISTNLMRYRSINRLIELYTQSNAQRITTVDADYIINKIVEIVTTANRDGDKLRGLELLARAKGLFIERTEITGRDGEAIRIEETRNQAEEVARSLREMGKKTGLSVVTGGRP